MSQTIKFRARSSADSRGQYIARIIGRDSKFTFNREFIGTRSSYSTFAEIDDPGIYEECDLDRRGSKNSTFYFAFQTADGLVGLVAKRADAMLVSRRMDEGEAFAQIVVGAPTGNADQPWTFNIRGRREAKQVESATTVANAVNAVLVILQSLPERLAKQAIRQAVAQAFPKTPKSPEPVSPENGEKRRRGRPKIAAVETL